MAVAHQLDGVIAEFQVVASFMGQTAQRIYRVL